MPMALSAGGRWLIYALGGGLGHLTRSLALARAAGVTVRVLTNSPFAACLPFEQATGPQVSLLRIDPTLGRVAVAEVVGATLEPCDFDVLVVDTFPRGLGGEL